ncbi:DUF2314 domain-containing protein [Aureibacter tunicatorum]|uniref:Uncharacterized protein YegJ (DUF2314 family) n=1 Tax=Aureibacter tunicatorum TaxID=866807 RepID=A0AAE4BUK7_9BACT|nr:DUF2314 domain-containing protein [Aureibacter tunicatorum]MDR6241180.1 uncharacterized protein YegJ (DUF2314 family) [Aureibacter tunicatorum]BDD03955.1 hypothetical protein AUTU_14380 [Aureibacter tunicatorum]
MKILLLPLLLFCSLLVNAQDEESLILVNKENEKMDKAFLEAKETLDQFISRATVQRKEHEIYGAYIKVVQNEVVEYLWVSDFQKYNETYFIGVLITKPELTTQFKKGATIGFLKEDIFDWQIYDKNTDVLEGAFTFKALE